MFNIKKYQHEYYLKNKEKNKKQKEKYLKKYYQIHKEKIKEQTKKYYETYHKKIKDIKQIWYLKNKNKILIQRKQYYLKNKKFIMQKEKIYRKRRRIIDINFKIENNLRTRLYWAIKNNSKYFTTMQLIDCSIEKLKQHLESQFKADMNWQNYGNGWNGKGMKEWHIDHIKSCSKFDLSRVEEQKMCFHYTNLQPLWARENLSKGNKIINQSKEKKEQ